MLKLWGTEVRQLLEKINLQNKEVETIKEKSESLQKEYDILNNELKNFKYPENEIIKNKNSCEEMIQ